MERHNLTSDFVTFVATVILELYLLFSSCFSPVLFLKMYKIIFVTNPPDPTTKEVLKDTKIKVKG